MGDAGYSYKESREDGTGQAESFFKLRCGSEPVKEWWKKDKFGRKIPNHNEL